MDIVFRLAEPDCGFNVEVCILCECVQHRLNGDIAQLGERYNRTVEVGGSNPPVSTREKPADHLSGFFG